MDNLINQAAKIESNLIPFPGSKLVAPPSEVISLNLRNQVPSERTYNGPISGAMWEKVRSLKSSYTDSFDWSVYDELYAKFGDKQPFGGVVFGKTFRVANWHASCSKCHYSLELDTYGRGCVHNCHYCYAKMTLSKHGMWNRPHPMPLDLSELLKIFYTVFETDKRSKWREVLSKRIPLRIGSMSDSFMWMDRKYKVSLELLKILNHYDYPYVVFTRSDLIAQPEYLKAINPRLGAVQFSISGSNEELTRRIEPGAPTIKRRLAALKQLADNGIWTTVRLNPIFPTYPDGYFTRHEEIVSQFGGIENVPKFDLLDITKIDDFLDSLVEARVPSLLVGFARLSSYSLTLMKNEAKVDLRPFFRKEEFSKDKKRGDFDKVFSDSEITYYYKIIQSKSVKRGIRFSTCYIGNGVGQYYEHQNLWSNKTDCCDARGNVPAVQSSAQEIPWEVRAKFAHPKYNITKVMEEDLSTNKTNEAPGLKTQLRVNHEPKTAFAPSP